MNTIFLITLLLASCLAQEFTIESSSQCHECANNNMKVCKGPYDHTKRYCCDMADLSYNCGIAMEDQCTDQITDQGPFFDNGKDFLLCDSYNDCNDSEYYAEADSWYSFYKESFELGKACIIRLWNKGDKSSKIKVQEIDIFHAEVFLYSYDPSLEKPYKFEGLLDAYRHEDEFIHAPENQTLHLVVVPEASNSRFGMTYKSIKDEATPMPILAIVGIIIGSIFLLTLLTLCCCYIVRRKRNYSHTEAQYSSPRAHLDLTPDSEYTSIQSDPNIRSNMHTFQQHSSDIYDHSDYPSKAKNTKNISYPKYHAINDESESLIDQTASSE
ncbi:unnamed protein product [Moneuplotes crassus]|uniref:CUB domain-containing protein n=1 Tax=Euplotes crassus TaxID=5936 RepID=A0AAD2CY17_EUPCR|nr:unnamed protein product [Moneuplotes crassus]